MKRALTVLFVLFAFCAFAEDVITLKDSDVHMRVIGSTKGLTVPHGMRPAGTETDWQILFLSDGYSNLGATYVNNVRLQFTEPINSYLKHIPAYFAITLGNFDTTAHNVTLKWELTGGKVITAITHKNVPARTVAVVWITRPLATVPSVYAMDVTAFEPAPGVPAPGIHLDSIWTRWIVNEVGQ